MDVPACLHSEQTQPQVNKILETITPEHSIVHPNGPTAHQNAPVPSHDSTAHALLLKRLDTVRKRAHRLLAHAPLVAQRLLQLA